MRPEYHANYDGAYLGQASPANQRHSRNGQAEFIAEAGVKNGLAIPCIAAAVTFVALCLLFSGAPNDAGFLASLDPVGAVGGLSFALSFVVGLSPAVAIIVAVAVFASVPVAVFFIARRFLGRRTPW